MAEKKEKISKLAITVDLSCRCCYKKIQKVLCKLQERGEPIQTISYDEKKNTVTVSGPFDPHKLSKKLWCKACKVITSIEIVPPPPPPTPTPQPPPPKVEPCKVINDVQIVVCDHHKDPKCTVQTSCKKEPEPEKPKETESKKDSKDKKEGTPKKECCKVINDIEIIVVDPKKCSDKKPKAPPPKPEKAKPPDEKPKPPPDEKPKPCPKPAPCCPPVLPVCCMMPCYVGHQGGSRCCSCGRVYGCVPDCPPLHYGGPSHGGFQFFCEEDPPTSCTIM